MKKLLLITLLGASVLAKAQKQYAIVVNGGKFESGVSTYEDRASIGVIDLESKSYHFLKQIQVESVQKIALNAVYEPIIFVAAQDSVLAYNFNSGDISVTEYGKIHFPAVKTIEASENYLAVGKWYGGGDYLKVYTIERYPEFNYVEHFVSSTIKTEIKDLLILDNSYLAVSYNLQGTVDACVPWGCFSDSIGRVDIIDLDNAKTIQTIDLGAGGKGNITLSPLDLRQFVICSAGNESFYLVNSSFEIDSVQTNTGITSLISKVRNAQLVGISNQDSLVEIKKIYKKETGTYSLEPKNQAFLQTGKKSIQSGDRLYLTDTDYSTYGNVLMNMGKDTVKVAVSPEDVAVAYFGPLGLWSQNVIESNNVNTVFAEEISTMNLSNISLFDMSGKLLFENENAQGVSFRNLEAGIYVLKSYQDKHLISLRVVKK